jgi:hypothetical protein
MPVAKAIALSNAIHHRANKNREHEAARWVWQHRQGVALSYPAAHDDGMEVTLIKNPKDEAAIRAVAREVNADGRHRDNERPTDLSDALTKRITWANISVGYRSSRSAIGRLYKRRRPSRSGHSLMKWR